ncbi:MAG: diphthamide synthesis protein [Candidatus Altiarchaeota archaeon]|nr:diphthamide synthesis protein [Candidatus Altiarchaeota archaeon]
MNYDFEIDRVCEEIRKTKAKSVGLQFPEGLKTKALDVAREIERRCSVTTFIFADPCYGACDTKEPEAKRLGIDLIIHFGHDEF